MNQFYSSNDHTWADELECKGAIVLEDTDDQFLVVDAYHPWFAVRVPWGDPDAFQRLEKLKADANESSKEIRELCEITYVGSWPPSKEACDAIDEAGKRYGPKATRLIIHFSDPETDLVEGLNHFVGPDTRCTAEFLGPLPNLDEDDVAHLISRGVSVRQTAGWPLNNVPDLDRISQVSELGLRVPVVWYVHRENIAQVLESANTMLFTNYNAGVAFEPICAHPQFTLDAIDFVPSAEDYSEMLIDAYKQFRHYDDVFEPLRSLIRNLQYGGWNRELGHGLPIRIRIDGSGELYEYRQLPWRSSTDVEVPHDAGLQLAEPCHACRWKATCGGCEQTDPQLFDLICEYRMLYLEFFVRKMHQGLKKVVEA